jgi:hypothetical protein
LELLQRVYAAFFESELAGANQTLVAVPVTVWSRFDRRIKAEEVVCRVTAVTEQSCADLATLSAHLALWPSAIFF